MVVVVLEVLGIVALVAAGFLVAPALGAMVFGVACLATAFALARAEKVGDEE
ncbi:MAG: hypothetical protein ACO3VO_10410 [Ilumatobacteraceae bacterium]|jgi:hypothetical protein